MSTYWQSGVNYQWDAQARSPYLSVPASGSGSVGDGKDHFIPYENALSITEKIAHAKSPVTPFVAISGTFVWELSAGYMQTPPSGHANDALLQAVKSSAYTFTLSGSSAVRSGQWSLVSVPLNIPNMAKNNIWSTATTPAYYFKDGYIRVNGEQKIVPGKAYWLKFPTGITSIAYNGSTSGTGASIRSAWVTVKVNPGAQSGWNTIGGLTEDLLIGKIRSLPDGIVSSDYWEYNPVTGTYVAATVLKPGKGYWVQVTADGMLRLDQDLPNIQPPTPPATTPPPPPSPPYQQPPSFPVLLTLKITSFIPP